MQLRQFGNRGELSRIACGFTSGHPFHGEFIRNSVRLRIGLRKSVPVECVS